MRARIMQSIMEEPKNANQLSKEVGVNYRTVEHHLKVLMENSLITSQGDGYGMVYFLSPAASRNIEIIEKVFKETFRKSDGK